MFAAVLSAASDAGHLGDLLRLMHLLLLVPRSATPVGASEDASRSVWPAIVAGVRDALESVSGPSVTALASTLCYGCWSAAQDLTERGSFDSVSTVLRPSFSSAAGLHR